MGYTKTASNSQHTVLRQNLTVDSTNGDNSILNLALGSPALHPMILWCFYTVMQHELNTLCTGLKTFC